ncbi:hypothetical protein [Schleiferilactobacillus harbinensis]|uniref:Uncharacterized protein n=1 Tax=Schleiferilactobacillus harbinensis TaxID=304207 RepID=A0A5P8M0I0_9LACO|nr:hypothetical protein [Schleiferilactobacillus harbinensis]QFR21990.1 hypothetical protein D1010_00230 [Schleiferilactobacillus harbinensis]
MKERSNAGVIVLALVAAVVYAATIYAFGYSLYCWYKLTQPYSGVDYALGQYFVAMCLALLGIASLFLAFGLRKAMRPVAAPPLVKGCFAFGLVVSASALVDVAVAILFLVVFPAVLSRLGQQPPYWRPPMV